MLIAAESKYGVTHLEALAVVWALKHFRDIIVGYPITVYTLYVYRPMTATLRSHAATKEILGRTYKLKRDEDECLYITYDESKCNRETY